MRAQTGFFLDYKSVAKLNFASNETRWLDISDRARGLSELTLYFPREVPNEMIKAVEDAINDALEAGQAARIAALTEEAA